MDKIADRLNKPFQKRKYRFITDVDSKPESSSDSDSFNRHEPVNNRPRSRGQSRSYPRFKQHLRRYCKFLTETSSQSFCSSQEQNQSSSPKRQGSFLAAEANEPKKKLKINEGQIDLNKVVEDGFSFVERIRANLSTNKQ